MPLFRSSFSVLCLAFAMSGASAQTFPSKTIRVIAPGGGGGSDYIARLVGQSLSPTIGQPVVVDNRPSGIIPGQLVARADPDGYTLVCYGNPLWLLPLMQSAPSYDPVRDLAPVTFVARAPNLLIVHPSLPAKSVKDLVALLKSKPGQLNYAYGSGVGSSGHLASELFKFMAGVDVVAVAYKGQGPAITDVISGQVEMMFASGPTAVPHIQSGRLRALGITSAAPSAVFPGLPTLASSGMPGYEAEGKFVFMAPGKTPESIRRQLSQQIIAVLNTPDVKAKLLPLGMEVVGSSPEELGAMIRSEMTRMGKLIKDAGIRAP
jgi:tripartite-type tricarboxylate transporter receptor subunit TctC